MNYKTQAEADARALQECGQGCRIVHRFSNTCKALATDQASGSTVYGHAHATTSAEAQANAMQFCRQYGGSNCVLRVWGCDTTAPAKTPVAEADINGMPSSTAAEEQADQIARNPGDVFRDCPDCPEMVVIPSGSFRMGCLSNDSDCRVFEEPVHGVTISRAFALGKHEVTFAQWDACVSAGGCNGYRPDDNGWGRGDRPVVNVSWEDAQLYVSWLSSRTGYAYRLPSESEWEYAARSGTLTKYIQLGERDRLEPSELLRQLRRSVGIHGPCGFIPGERVWSA